MNDDLPKPSRAPILLSSFVMPGLGQFAQRRWMAGLLYALGFLVPFAAVMVEAIRILSRFYGLGFDIFSTDMPEQLTSPMLRLGIWFVVAIVLFGANLADVYLAYRRACADWARRKARLPDLPA
jgi:predicted transporter